MPSGKSVGTAATRLGSASGGGVCVPSPRGGCGDGSACGACACGAAGGVSGGEAGATSSPRDSQDACPALPAESCRFSHSSSGVSGACGSRLSPRVSSSARRAPGAGDAASAGLTTEAVPLPWPYARPPAAASATGDGASSKWKAARSTPCDETRSVGLGSRERGAPPPAAPEAAPAPPLLGASSGATSTESAAVAASASSASPAAPSSRGGGAARGDATGALRA